MTDQLVLEWIKETCDAYCIPKPFAIVEALEAARATAEQRDTAPEPFGYVYRIISESRPHDPMYRFAKTGELNPDPEVVKSWTKHAVYTEPQAPQSRDSVIEQCALIVEQHQETFTTMSGGEEERHLTTRRHGNQMGMAYANAIRALKSQQDAAIESKQAEHITNDEVRTALDEMGKIADDPMWANHCEITKISLRRWIKALRGAYYKGYAEAGYDSQERPDAAIEAQRSGDGS